jgi:hypothetical protein
VEVNVSDDSKGHELIQRIATYAIDGVWKLSGAVALAEEYSRNPKYGSAEETVDALVRWGAGKNFSTGFVTGLGGVLTLPISLPAGLGASWVIQARLAAAIAWALLGDSVKEVIKDVGIQIGRKTAEQALRKLPGKVLVEINKKVGYRLMTKFGEKGVVNVVKVVPVAGGIVGGAVDAAATIGLGQIAKTLFPPIRSTAMACDPGQESSARGAPATPRPPTDGFSERDEK